MQRTMNGFVKTERGKMGNVLCENGFPIYALVSGQMVEVQEVRHGRWEKMDGTDLWCCSVCGNTIYSEDETDRERFHKWCGRCGALMDGDEE